MARGHRLSGRVRLLAPSRAAPVRLAGHCPHAARRGQNAHPLHHGAARIHGGCGQHAKAGEQRRIHGGGQRHGRRARRGGQAAFRGRAAPEPVQRRRAGVDGQPGRHPLGDAAGDDARAAGHRAARQARGAANRGVRLWPPAAGLFGAVLHGAALQPAQG